ncbi:MAG: SDR family oxidoreductase [Pseudomonadota bacterium]|nr:SDR family oxidoreductase [Pseudomonadota bacterium]
MRFLDSVIWITGASSGIGAEMAMQFYAEGAHLVMSSRDRTALKSVGSTCNGLGEILILPLDVTDEKAVIAAAQQVIDRFGRVDVLVNNAGLTQRSLIAETSLDVYRRIMDVNFFGPLLMTKAVLPAMLDMEAGQIVCVTSVAGKYGSPMRSGYNAAKHAAHGFFESLREEVSAHGISVTLILPGAVKTNVSLNALCGDGSRYNKMDPFLAMGMEPAECARRTLNAIHGRKREVMIATGVARRNVWLKRLSPALLSWVTRRRRRHQTAVLTDSTN